MRDCDPPPRDWERKRIEPNKGQNRGSAKQAQHNSAGEQHKGVG